MSLAKPRAVRSDQSIGRAALARPPATSNAHIMNRNTVFSKTGKGLLEIKSKASRLAKDQFRVLNLVDGKATLQDLTEKSKISEPDMKKILGFLTHGGFLKEFSQPAAAAGAAAGEAAGAEDLDFTQMLGPATQVKPAAPPPPAADRRAPPPAPPKPSEADAAKAREEAARRQRAARPGRTP